MITKEVTEVKTVFDTDKLSTYDGIVIEIQDRGEKYLFTGIVLNVYSDSIKVKGFRLGKPGKEQRSQVGDSLHKEIGARDIATGEVRVIDIIKAETKEAGQA